MTMAPSLWSFISDAGWVVKIVMLILLFASIASWTIIIQRALLLKHRKQEAKDFDQTFWSGIDLNTLWKKVSLDEENLIGMNRIFHAGFHAYSRLTQQATANNAAVIEATQRAMRVAEAQEMETIERNLSLLATVGSVSPYVGLFGTVWGIMTAFRSLGGVQQATIAMVAPGISEALIATAMGLFAAIPAVVAYNRFNNELERLAQKYAIFQEEFIGILQRQLVQAKPITEQHISDNTTNTEQVAFDPT